ncbi:MAG: universal stress protein [Bacteroidetes bacterium]|nr:universal stress protein [Bacteroidota bacterium]
MNIIFPTDFSEQSADAFEMALYLAEKTNPEILLLHVYSMPMVTTSIEDGGFDTMPDQLIRLSEEAATNRIAQFKDSLINRYNKGYGNRIPVTEVLRMGFVADEIVALAEKEDVFCIVIPVVHTTGMDRLLFGGIVSSVLKKSNSPVFTVPKDFSFRQIQRLAYATDLTFADNEVIDKLLFLADIFEAELKCFHVHDSNLEIENSIIQDFITQYSNEVERKRISFQLIENLNVLDGMDYFVKENRIDLLGMLRQKSYMNSLFNISYTKKMSSHSEIPLIIYHE